MEEEVDMDDSEWDAAQWNRSTASFTLMHLLHWLSSSAVMGFIENESNEAGHYTHLESAQYY